jgi:signal recognition particle GTPase
MNPRKIVKAFIPRKLFKSIEPYGHLGEAVFFNVLNDFPARHMKVIGVTGTNGKTTTAFMIHKMLNEAGYKVGLMSTVAYGVGDDMLFRSKRKGE